MAEPAGHLRALPGNALEADYVGPTGLRKPSRTDRVGRSLTDVIVELGLAPRERVIEAMQVSAETGTPPERVLLSLAAISPDAIAIAIAERYALDYVDLAVFHVDMTAAKSKPARKAKFPLPNRRRAKRP